MKKGRINVDFNEMIEEGLVLLSKTDVKVDSSGKEIKFFEGMIVHIYEQDFDLDGNIDNLIADGEVVLNKTGIPWTLNAKWCCKIDSKGIRHESDE
ncbi:hypothetical protein WJT86_12220 [Microvirga sp. W0021]|uniref:Uncharacterized protein n=1 Tax=Hohaiivirga grylli TaxID=3133970 RepID=A0ABV0BNA9_9HYPH